MSTEQPPTVAATAGPSADWAATLVAGALAALAMAGLLPVIPW